MNSDLDKVLGLAQSTVDLGADILQAWMTSANEEIRAIAYTLLIDQPGRCTSVSEREKYDFMLTILADAMKRDSDFPMTSFQFGRFDALLYANSLLRSWKSGTSDQRRALDRLVDLLGELCLANNGIHQQLVMDVTFEHIMTDPDYRQMFEKWQDDSQLLPVFERACEVAKEWDRGKCRKVRK